MKQDWQTELVQKLSEKYVNPQNSQEWANFDVSTNGLVNLTVISDHFKALSITERQQEIEDFLQKFSVSPGFMELYTIEEANSLNLSRPPSTNGRNVKTWQDLALWASNPQNASMPDADYNQSTPPRTVTFYSYKGGVGRTTALTHVAYILAMRGRKVIVVDLDLEAPSLRTAFQLDKHPHYGIVDYFYERAYLPKNVKPNISITEIFSSVNIPDATGRLFVVPAGILSLDYISKVDDLRAASETEDGQSLWSVFKQEIQEQLNPDIILVDSRTGINEWGAFSMLQAANEVLIFLFPNEQNKEGVKILLESLLSLDKLQINFVFSPVPDLNDKSKVLEIERVLQQELTQDDETVQEGETEPLMIPYVQPIALADSYPVHTFLDYYNRIANLIDTETNELQIEATLQDQDKRWEIIESLDFSPLNASDPDIENHGLLFQKTADFEKFLDETTCLIRGRKGTGKTALYWLLLNHEKDARKLASGRLENVQFVSGHGRFNNTRPTRNEFEVIHQKLKDKGGTWESFWRLYLLLKVFQSKQLNFLPRISRKTENFRDIRDILKDLARAKKWQAKHTQKLIELSTNPDFKLLAPDVLDLLDDTQQEKNTVLWFLYDDLDEDFPKERELRNEALRGLFQLIQACDARKLKFIRFKIFLREDIWERLNFDNKSHFNGRDISLQWTRIDFLRLSLRQAIRSPKFKELVDRLCPIEDINHAKEEMVERALEFLWGSRRRKGYKAKYVSRWVYERLTDSSGTTFPRSLSALLRGAKEQELTYKEKSSIQAPKDRLLRSKSLEVGLEKASEERCDAIKQEYPDLGDFFNSLEGVNALPECEEIKKLWRDNAQEVISEFDKFSDLLSDIGLAQWRDKEKRYAFADIYVYGFKMNRLGTK
ncbi:AAA family ATPase [Spirulina sp. CS-785/01]|uniref:MinD/ParA family ATP-binding protein n=1 Tax=Spirulina sp. CS-785/01 TaxID=3021716 RepID=UPI00232F0290|nr:AAA family ATPase [Spirulina sp. CS-785/01]MDB9315771.1 AAA family ATPase [Spirulina sp. CS-785/01]